MEYETLLYELDGPVGTLTLNVPDRLNAHGRAMRKELLHFWRARQNDEGSCRVIIFTGAGRAFCAGADLNELGDSSRPLEEMYGAADEMSEVVFLMRRAPQPVIGAIRGWAAGGGFSIALAADMRIVDPSARFLPSFINIGLSGGDMMSSYYLPRQVGLGMANQYLLTGDVMDAGTALSHGFANHIVAAKDLVPKAREMAAKMIEKSVLGLRMTKETINRNLSASLDQAIQLENRNQVLCLGSRPIANPFKKRR